MHKPPTHHLLNLLLLLLPFLPLFQAHAALTLSDPSGGYGACTMCLLLDNPKELTPCSDAWRQLMSICSTPACSNYASYVSKAPPVASCTNTPNPLPGGTAGAGFSFSWISSSRGSPTDTGGPGFISVTRTSNTQTGTGTRSESEPTASSRSSSSDTTSTTGAGRDSGIAVVEPTPTGTSTPRGTNPAVATATGGVARVVAGSLGVGWLWEAVFMYWGAAW